LSHVIQPSLCVRLALSRNDAVHFFGERSRLGCCSARLAPNIRGVAVTKW
jgi:hypothetical protein